MLPQQQDKARFQVVRRKLLEQERFSIWLPSAFKQYAYDHSKRREGKRHGAIQSSSVRPLHRSGSNSQAGS
jgi:hypothetical protein